ncbi:MAG: lipopolysaccharide biosynthesis protein RfbH [Clostridiaceae bacterium]|nr:lipopolysaccharide biosynthesis protein RfbH [Clostridiaceae bacterium]
MKNAQELKQKILELTEQYYQIQFGQPHPFIEGERIGYAGRVFDQAELQELVCASLEFWLTAGHYTQAFEHRLASYIGVKYCSLVNSGSSANLLAFAALTSPMLGDRRIRRGDEVITVAAGFPTTITPILQYGAVPVFIDIEKPCYNLSLDALEKAVSPKTRAVMAAHTLGNPFPLEEVRRFCDAHGLWLVEDNCDALGAEYCVQGEWKKTGSVGHIATSSFYPAHHITMGEGGAVYTDDALLHRIVNSMRDWGRDCWCQPGCDNTCGCRFEGRWGTLPQGYDHKYVYSHFGYNLKATDLQAAIGCAQMDKLEGFVSQRRRNWSILRRELDELSDVLLLPEETPGSRPSWFGFLITVKESAPFSRNALVQYLESRNIQTRNLFAGNFLRHPCFDELREEQGAYRIAGELMNTDDAMERAFWIGVYPGMTDEKLHYMANAIKTFVRERGPIS